MFLLSHTADSILTVVDRQMEVYVNGTVCKIGRCVYASVCAWYADPRKVPMRQLKSIAFSWPFDSVAASKCTIVRTIDKSSKMSCLRVVGKIVSNPQECTKLATLHYMADLFNQTQPQLHWEAFSLAAMNTHILPLGYLQITLSICDIMPTLSYLSQFSIVFNIFILLN